MTRKPNGVSAFMAQHVNYGGTAATRHQVYQDMMLKFPGELRAAEYTAFARPALAPEDVGNYIPWGMVCMNCAADLRIRSSHPIESLCHPCWESLKLGKNDGAPA